MSQNCKDALGMSVGVFIGGLILGTPLEATVYALVGIWGFVGFTAFWRA